MADSTAASYLDEAFRAFRGYKRMADGALNQLDDREFFHVPDTESNSVALIVKHMAGNLRSRWTDFYASDGEKPDRHRDTEFEKAEADTRESLMELWESGWATLFEIVDSMKPDDLTRTVTIRDEPHSVIKAVNRQLAHYAYHVGQIVFLAKHFAGERWQSLSIPRGQSEIFNAKMRGAR